MVILFLEENEISRDRLPLHLERQGYPVLMTIEGALSLTNTGANFPLVSWIDSRLSVFDESQGTPQLRMISEPSPIRVLSFIGDANTEQLKPCFVAGFDNDYPKPAQFAQPSF